MYLIHNCNVMLKIPFLQNLFKIDCSIFFFLPNKFSRWQPSKITQREHISCKLLLQTYFQKLIRPHSSLSSHTRENPPTSMVAWKQPTNSLMLKLLYLHLQNKFPYMNQTYRIADTFMMLQWLPHSLIIWRQLWRLINQ